MRLTNSFIARHDEKRKHAVQSHSSRALLEALASHCQYRSTDERPPQGGALHLRAGLIDAVNQTQQPLKVDRFGEVGDDIARRSLLRLDGLGGEDDHRDAV
jgi:hypothetical protein